MTVQLHLCDRFVALEVVALGPHPSTGSVALGNKRQETKKLIAVYGRQARQQGTGIAQLRLAKSGDQGDPFVCEPHSHHPPIPLEAGSSDKSPRLEPI